MSLTVFALFCLVSVINGQRGNAWGKTKADPWPFHINNAQLTTAAPVTGEFEANLKTTAQFNLTHTAAIQICFNEEYPITPNSSTWPVGCTFYWTFPAGSANSQGQLPLRFADYNVGIYFAGAVVPGQSDVISLHVGQGPQEVCADDLVWNSVECVPVVEIEDDGSTFQNFTGNVTSIFSFEVPKAPKITGSAKISGPTDFTFVIRRDGTPTNAPGLFDASGKGIAQVNFPRPGTYYVAVTTATTQNATITVTLEDCTHAASHGSGPGCATIFDHDDSNENLHGEAGKLWTNYVVYASPKNPLYVATASNDGSAQPTIYASQGQVPEPGNADITGCNVQNCGAANVISRTPTKNETWFIAVGAKEGQSYAVWFNSICAPSCAHSGRCITDGADAGKCVCNKAEDSGAGCQVSSALAQQYVVLAAIWGTAAGLTIIVLAANYFSTGKDTYERVA